MRHTIAILLENAAGSLSRVAGLFSARAYNIESLSVAPTEDPTVSRLTLVTRGSPEMLEQIVKQLNKLIDVIRLVDLNEGQAIERELLLIKIFKDQHIICSIFVAERDGNVLDLSKEPLYPCNIFTMQRFSVNLRQIVDDWFLHVKGHRFLLDFVFFHYDNVG